MRQVQLPKSHTVTFGTASHSMPFGDHHPMPVNHPVKPWKRSHLEPVAASCSWDISSMSPISSWCQHQSVVFHGKTIGKPLENGGLPSDNGSCKSCSPWYSSGWRSPYFCFGWRSQTNRIPKHWTPNRKSTIGIGSSTWWPPKDRRKCSGASNKVSRWDERGPSMGGLCTTFHLCSYNAMNICGTSPV